METDSLAELAHAHLEQARFLIEISAGYYQSAIDAGFTHETAEKMALDFHRSLLQQMVGDSA